MAYRPRKKTVSRSDWSEEQMAKAVKENGG